MAGASLRLAPWKNGVSGGGLTGAAAAGAIRAAVNNRVESELIRAAVATWRRRRRFACEAVLALALITTLAVAVRQPCRRCARIRASDREREHLPRRLDERRSHLCRHRPSGLGPRQRDAGRARRRYWWWGATLLPRPPNRTPAARAVRRGTVWPEQNRSQCIGTIRWSAEYAEGPGTIGCAERHTVPRRGGRTHAVDHRASAARATGR